MPKIKTLIVHPALAPYRVDLFNQLAQEVDLHIVFLQDYISYYPKLNQNNLKISLRCRYQILQSGISLKNRTFPIGLNHIMREFNPDVIVTHEFSNSTLWIMLQRILFKKERYAHVLWTTENVPMFKKRRFIRRGLRKLCSSSVHSLLVYSDEIAKEFVHHFGIPQEKIYICANLQDEKIFRSKLAQALRIVPQYINDYQLGGKKVILYVGRLDTKKNLKMLIESFAQVSIKEPSAILTFVGDGPERKSLELRAKRCGLSHKVYFIGHCEGYNLLFWYVIGSFLVLPSTWEPYGAVVNEALLSGMPVLCSSEAGARVLIQDGKNGYVFNPYDVNVLSNLLEKMLMDVPSIEASEVNVRESLMPISFDRDLNSFMNAVQYAAKQVGA